MMPAMKLFVPSLLAVLMLFAGCSKTRPAASKGTAPEIAVKEEPVIRPVTRPIGRISSVNPVSRFVVITYPSSILPKNEQRLGVYREGRKVGEVKVTGPERDTITAADMVSGDAQIGDEVREN